MTASGGDPHRDGVLLRAGEKLENATGAVILLHGRGGSAEDILELSAPLSVPGVAYLAPEAAGRTWYPYSFLVPREQNEPWLSSALRRVEATVKLTLEAGISAEKIVVCGFSQGACLSTEYVASHPQRYGGLVAFTGGLIGSPDSPLTQGGDLAGTPAFLGSGDPDPHVPWTRVEESARILEEMGAMVTLRRYPGRHHTVSREEVAVARELILAALGGR